MRHFSAGVFVVVEALLHFSPVGGGCSSSSGGGGSGSVAAVVRVVVLAVSREVLELTLKEGLFHGDVEDG